MKRKSVTGKELLEMRKTGSKEELASTVRLMSKRLNERFRQLERKANIKTNIAYKYAQNELGVERPRYTESLSKLNKMSMHDLYMLSIDINQKLNAKTSTLTGIKEASRNRILGDLVSPDVQKFMTEGLGEHPSENSENIFSDMESLKKFFDEMGETLTGNNIPSGELFEIYAMSYNKGIEAKAIADKIKDLTDKDTKLDMLKLKRWLK